MNSAENLVFLRISGEGNLKVYIEVREKIYINAKKQAHKRVKFKNHRTEEKYWILKLKFPSLQLPQSENEKVVKLF